MNAIIAKLVSFTLFCVFLSFQCSGAKYLAPTTLVQLSEAQLLPDGKGYLLIDLDLDGVAPSLAFSKIKGNDIRYLSKDKKKIKLTSQRKLNLKNKSKGYHILALPEGLYQVTRINVPFFNLPYRLHTSNRRDWRFSIEKGKLNYIGKLFIDKERSADSVYVRLFNRIAADKQRLDNEINQLPIIYPLASAAGVRDDFYMDFNMNEIEQRVQTNEATNVQNKNQFDD